MKSLLLSVALLLVLFAPGSGWADACAPTDQDVSAFMTANLTDPIPNTRPGVQGTVDKWNGTAEADEWGQVIRSVFVARDSGFLDYAEVGVSRYEGQTTWRPFYHLEQGGLPEEGPAGSSRVADKNSFHIKFYWTADRPAGIRWDFELDSEFVEEIYTSVPREFTIYVGALVERHGTCEDSRAHWSNLQYVSNVDSVTPPQWSGWAEIQDLVPTDAELGHECRKGTSDIEWYSRRIGSSAGPESLCQPDPDPLG